MMPMMPMRCLCPSILSVLAVVLAIVQSIAASSPDGPPPAYPNTAIRKLVTARCGESGTAVWRYEGTLSDPMNGQVICGVEGIEIVRYLGGPAENERRRTLQSEQLPGYTVLSRKLFCYKEHRSNSRSRNDNTSLLQSFRLRPNSPARTVPTSQAVALYDTATTIFNQRNGTRLVCHTEMADGRSFWSRTDRTVLVGDSPTDSDHIQSVDFSLFTRSKEQSLPDLFPDDDDDSDGGSGLAGVIVAPKRSRLIQFGSGDGSVSSGGSGENKYGVRETYSYNFEGPTSSSLPSSTTQSEPHPWKFWVKKAQPSPVPPCSVRYTRYGEGPPWYGPGRYCTLELKGRRLEGGLGNLPPIVASFASENLPGVLAASISPIRNDDDARMALRSFRDSRTLWESLDDAIDGDQGSTGKSPRPLKGLWRNHALPLWSKLRAASTHKSLPTDLD